MPSPSRESRRCTRKVPTTGATSPTSRATRIERWAMGEERRSRTLTSPPHRVVGGRELGIGRLVEGFVVVGDLVEGIVGVVHVHRNAVDHHALVSDRSLLDRHRPGEDRKSTRLNSSHVANSYAVF